MAILTVDDIAAALALDQFRAVLKNITVPKAIGSYQSSWLGVGFPGAGATPPAYTAGSGYTASSATTGAIIYTNGAVKNWLAQLFASSTIAGTLFIYDRLWACSGMGYAAATYTVTTPGSLPARITDNGVGCELWVEQNNAAAGSASGTLTANYKNPADGAEAGVIPTVVSAPVIGQAQPVPLQAGATGVRSLVSVVTSATWTSGTFGMMIVKPVCSIEIPLAGIGKTLDWAGLGLPGLVNDMCLFFIWQGGATTANQVMARLNIIDK
jgi:hypothetical protein